LGGYELGMGINSEHNHEYHRGNKRSPTASTGERGGIDNGANTENFIVYQAEITQAIEEQMMETQCTINYDGMSGRN
jgi:hypothetical protein